MIIDIYEIWIEAEEWAVGEYSIQDDNTDVLVKLTNGDNWVATFFTYNNIAKLLEKNKQTGEMLSGKYFWSSNMILIDEISRERIQEVITTLINDGTFNQVFTKCS